MIDGMTVLETVVMIAGTAFVTLVGVALGMAPIVGLVVAGYLLWERWDDWRFRRELERKYPLNDPTPHPTFVTVCIPETGEKWQVNVDDPSKSVRINPPHQTTLESF